MLPGTMPEWRGTTNGDLYIYIEDLKTWGLSCEADKARILEWSEFYGSEDN